MLRVRDRTGLLTATHCPPGNEHHQHRSQHTGDDEREA
jgi:hypothetical protein